MQVNNVTIGADPELFIVDERSGKVVSSIGLIPGVKGNPWVGSDMPKGFGLEIDNILAEFNIPPVKDEVSFVNNIEYMKEYINKFVKEKNAHYGIRCSASEIVDEDQLQSQEAKEFGCSVDYCVYTNDENPKPEGERTNLRSAGFHIHIGYDNFNVDTSLALIKFLDAFVGLPALLLDRDNRRRSLYGKAGCFRLTGYGLEYRVLSSAMMKDKYTLSFVFRQVSRAIAKYNIGWNIPPTHETRQAINTGNVGRAAELISAYELVGPVDRSLFNSLIKAEKEKMATTNNQDI